MSVTEVARRSSASPRSTASRAAADLALMRDVYAVHHGIVTLKESSNRG
jgi:hypothetical protein